MTTKIKTRARIASPAIPKPQTKTAPGKDGRGKAKQIAASPESAGTLSPDAICLRAYFIGQHRREANLPGDELSDWLEAERQLLGERAAK